MQTCSRHRAKHAAPGTPKHFWDIGMEDTMDYEEQGKQTSRKNFVCFYIKDEKLLLTFTAFICVHMHTYFFPVETQGNLPMSYGKN